MKKSVFVIGLCAACVAVFYGVRYINNPLEVQTIVSEDYENKIDAEGYIVCDEQVYTTDTGGTVYHYVRDGARVKKNSMLSAVYTGNVSEETLQELNNINKKLSELESMNTEYSYLASTSSDIGNMNNIIKNIITAKNNGNISKISSYKSQISTIITGNTESAEVESRDALINRKTELETGIQNSKTDIYSQISGIYSKNVDGLETVLTPDTVKNYKLDDFLNIPEPVKPENNFVAAGQNVCKVVDNHQWYVMLTVDKNALSDIKVGRKVRVRFDSMPGSEADAQIVAVSTETDDKDKNVVVLQCEQYIEGIYSVRRTNVELILESYEGFKVPISAIRLNDDGEKCVLVKSGGTEVFKRCEIIYSNTEEASAIITPATGGGNVLSEYDEVVIGEK